MTNLILILAAAMSWHSSTPQTEWKTTRVRLASKPAAEVTLAVNPADSLGVFQGFGTCFNELGYDALMMLPADDRDQIIRRLFAPDGDLRLTHGRIPMNASDYARDWYSCDEVPGDFQLRYFNIDRDLTTLIPYIRMAQAAQPALWFWASPWSPPSWMKINGDYPVRSDQHNHMDPRGDIALYMDVPGDGSRLFPQRLAQQDYMIQDPRYLQAYADYFCRFIEAYAGQGIPIRRVMYQNEAWSYTPYPGCAWTPEGIIRFNTQYLAPALRRQHPSVQLFFGTINTNRQDVIEQVMASPAMQEAVQGLGFQWEGSQILAAIKAQYPAHTYVQTESECGNGTFGWAAAEHTFELMSRYLGMGCQDYTFWNCILADEGISPWGWRQNALIRVDSHTGAHTLTPEFWAVRHYAQALPPGSRLLGSAGGQMPVIAYATPGGYAVLAANRGSDPATLCVQLGARYLNATLPPHSLNSFTL